MSVQLEASDAEHAIPLEGSVDSPKDADECSQDISSEVLVDDASELPEPSLPSWIAEDVSDELSELLPIAIRHIKAKRGGDLLGIIMPALDPDARSKRKGKISLLVIIKGEERDAQWIRVKRHLIEISYRGQKGFEEDLQVSLHIPPLLRKARVLFERDGIASRICDMTGKRFRHGPPHPSINEKIHLKAECYHWLGKIQEVTDHPDRARYILPAFLDQVVASWFRLHGLWQVSASEELQFISARDKALGVGLRDILTEHDMRKQVALAQRIAGHVLKDVPWPARID